MAELRIFFKILRPHFQNSFSQLFYIFCAKVKDTTLKSYWKPNTSVFLSTLWILSTFTHFGAFVLLWDLVSIIFTIFFMGSEVYLERCDSYDNFDLKQKFKKIIFREFCKRIHCPPIVTLALLLFLTQSRRTNHQSPIG